ncbi:MAG: alpha/beta hydrolase [Bacteroidota bacterium]
MDPLSQHPVKNISIHSLDYRYIEKGEGPTIIFLHGFPDLAHTWDESIESFSKDYHCVAPYLRGYYPTGIPENGDYRIKTIAEDIQELADQLGIERFYLVGQDWGASVVYAIMNLCPDRVIKAVTVAIPHPRVLKADLITLYKARHFWRFSTPARSLTYTRKNNFHYLDVLYKRWSPTWKNYQETSDQVKATFAKEGRLEAALGYYYSFYENRSNKELLRFYGKIQEIPLLAMAGKKDGALVLDPFYKMEEKMKAEFKLVIHEEAGHFLHREVPDFFIQEVQKFLAPS